MSISTGKWQGLPLSRHVPLSLGASGIGAGLLVGGIGLAIYSLGFASTPPDDPAQFLRSAPLTDPGGLSTRSALAALIVGIVTAVGAAVAIVRPRVRSQRRDGVGVFTALTFVAAVAVLPIVAVVNHVWHRYAQIRGQFPLFASLPTALAAAILVVAGTVLLGGVMRWPQHARVVTLRMYGVLVAVGLLVSGVVSVVAVRMGEDSVRVDHTTAAPVAVAPIPDRLGQQRYRIQIPVIRTDFGAAPGDVVPAGAGFVVANGAGLTAYDGVTGTQRWHYLRIQPADYVKAGVRYSPESLQSIDHGAVVLAHWEWLGWTAFDAMTGQILWQNSDFMHDAGTDGFNIGEYPEPRVTPGPLIGFDDNHVAGYNAHSGARLWSTPTGRPGCHDPKARLAVTDTAVYRLDRCYIAGKAWALATAIDPTTGTVRHTRDLGQDTGTREVGADISRVAETVLIRWDPISSSDTKQIVLTGPDQLPTAPISDFPKLDVAAASPDSTQQVRTIWRNPNDPDPYTLVAAGTGAPLYRLPGFVDDIESYPTDVVFLQHEIVQVTDYAGMRKTDHLHVRSWSRTDGRPLTDQQLGSVDTCVRRALPVPGAVLAFCYELGSEIVGFSTAE